MLLPLIPAIPAFAATDWEYRVDMYIASNKNAEAKGAPKAIMATLKFDAGDETATFDGCNGKDKTVSVYIKSSMPPWTLKQLVLTNLSGDGLLMHNAYVVVKNTSSAWGGSSNWTSKILLDYYPQGENDGHTGGMWIGGKDKNASPRTINIEDAERKRDFFAITSYSQQLGKDIHLKSSDANKSTAVEYNWDGMVKDQFSTASGLTSSAYRNGYCAWDESDAPTISVNSITGTNKLNKTIEKSQLSTFGFEVTEKGYKYTPNKMFKKMTDDGVGTFSVQLMLKFPASSTASGKDKYYATVTFTKDIFQFSNVSFENENYVDSATDRKFYNSNGDQTIKVNAKIQTGSGYAHITKSEFEGKEFKFTSAYLKTKNANEQEIRIPASGNSATISDLGVSLSFPFSGEIDSNNNGLKLYIEGGKITDSSNNTYELYDVNHKDGNTADYYWDASLYKVDSKPPKVTIEATSAVNLNKYNKYAEFTVKPDEDLYRYQLSSSARSEKEATLRLVPAGQDNSSVAIYRYNYYASNKPKSSLSTYTSQGISGVKNKAETVRIELAAATEGEFDLIVEGEDVAANQFQEKYTGIKLDNKAPEVFIKEEGQKRNTDTKTLSNTYKVSITDASGTGRLYYMFTEKDLSVAKNVPLNGSTGEMTVSDDGNDIYTNLGVWKFVDQKDIDSGRLSSIALTIKEGDVFNGNLIYYTEDDCDNKTECAKWNSTPIKMANENTSYTIEPKNLSQPSPSYNIVVSSGTNTVSYNWKRNTANGTEYLFDSFRPYNGTSINTLEDEETKNINGLYTLELQIVTPKKTATVKATADYYFDNAAPEIRFSLPSTNSYLAEQKITVVATDNTGVKPQTAFAKIVNADKSEISGAKEIPLDVENGSVKATVSAENLESGAYRIKATAADENGLTKTEYSDLFYIRSSAPEGSVKVLSSTEYLGLPIISSDDTIKLELDITDPFKNASYKVDSDTSKHDQKLYYRVSTSAGSFGQWQEAVEKNEKTNEEKSGVMSTSSNAFSLKTTVDVTGISLIDGERELYVQTAICPVDADTISFAANCIKEDIVKFYYDETAPTAELVIDNELHTTDPISGILIASDAYGTPTAKCADTNVVIGDYSNGAFKITVNKNVDTTVSVYDAAGNKTDVKVIVEGIDTKPPTVNVNADKVENGDRVDAEVMVTVSDMSETNGYMFALIPKNEYTDGGKIADKYFRENLSDDIHFEVIKSRSVNGTWEGEKTNTYTLNIADKSETLDNDGNSEKEWLIGVRAQDSLGNSVDYVSGDAIKTKLAPITCKYKVTPAKAEKKAIVSLEFSVPVYVLPQNMILHESTDAEKTVEEVNIELAEANAMSYSQKASFMISKSDFENTTSHTYDLYVVDDLGRAKATEITIQCGENGDVTFDASGELSYIIATKIWDDGDETFAEISADKICAEDYNAGYYLVVTPINNDTLLLPDGVSKEHPLSNMAWDNSFYETHGFRFELSDSSEYAVLINGELPDEYDNIKGYTKLIYSIYRVDDGVDKYGVSKAADISERILPVQAFDSSYNPFDTSDTSTSDVERITTKHLVVTEIDNTAPRINWYVTPDVIKYVGFPDGGASTLSLDDSAEFDGWEFYTTPGAVTYTVSAQDIESGIKRVIALTYCDVNGEEVAVEPQKPAGYKNGGWSWEWDGYQHSAMLGDGEMHHIPVRIEYFDDDGDIYGIKTLRYTFTEPFSMRYDNNLSGAAFYNSLGAFSQPTVYRWEGGGFSTENIIYNMPIEENVDYSVSYYDADGEEITDLDAAYYNKVKAVINILDRGNERKLSIVNNSGSTERELTAYRSAFEFKLKDKYGYEMYVPVELKNFDLTPGTLNYALSTTEKTNQPIKLTVTATDNESGVGSVSVIGASEVTLSGGTEGIYTGSITKNGAYSVVMYDKAGNKTVESFNVSNYDDEIPTATIVYQSGDKEWYDDATVDYYTSRPVNATLYFSKTNVKITNLEPIGQLTSSDYTVSYNSSTITFTKSGTLGVSFVDEYGNEGSVLVPVGNIDNTPPKLDVNYDNTDSTAVKVTFSKVDAAKADGSESELDKKRTEKDIYVSYGGVTAPVSYEENGVEYKSLFTFYENGTYTFKVYDDEGLTRYLDVQITGIDTASPVIESVTWSYSYDKLVDGQWETDTVSETITPKQGALGYRVGKGYAITNNDVTVTVKTDTPTKLLGGTADRSDTQTKVYDKNGLFDFNLEKKNQKMISYGVDIEVIDKTPPVIKLKSSELVFYENPEMHSKYSPELITGNIEDAYDIDIFGGSKIPLTDRVKIDYGVFDYENIDELNFDASRPYTITYEVTDDAHNTTKVKCNIRLVGMYDTVATVNGELPDYTGATTVSGDAITIGLQNFAGTAYVRYQRGVYTMGEMKKDGVMLAPNDKGEYELKGVSDGWYTFYIQTDKRDYFTLNVYVAN